MLFMLSQASGAFVPYRNESNQPLKKKFLSGFYTVRQLSKLFFRFFLFSKLLQFSNSQPLIAIFIARKQNIEIKIH